MVEVPAAAVVAVVVGVGVVVGVDTIPLADGWGDDVGGVDVVGEAARSPAVAACVGIARTTPDCGSVVVGGGKVVEVDVSGPTEVGVSVTINGLAGTGAFD